MLVVELSGTETARPGEAKPLALPVAAGAPVQSLVLKILTVVPASAEPLTSGLLLLAGEAGWVAVTLGGSGAQSTRTATVAVEPPLTV